MIDSFSHQEQLGFSDLITFFEDSKSDDNEVLNDQISKAKSSLARLSRQLKFKNTVDVMRKLAVQQQFNYLIARLASDVAGNIYAHQSTRYEPIALLLVEALELTSGVDVAEVTLEMLRSKCLLELWEEFAELVDRNSAQNITTKRGQHVS